MTTALIVNAQTQHQCYDNSTYHSFSKNSSTRFLRLL